MQVVAESASFAANKNNRQFLQDFNSKNFRPYPVYTPNLPTRPQKPKSNLTTLYNFRDRHLEQIQYKAEETSTKRSTLIPYYKPYTTAAQNRRDPYTRPGVSLLKDFLEKEKNKTLITSTEKISHATPRSDRDEAKEEPERKITIEANSFESATKIPQTTISQHSFATEKTSSDRLESYTSEVTQITTEPYQERRERLIRKLNLGTFGSTPVTEPTPTEKYYGDLPNRPGLVVPPSLTPKTLHSLAIYYATALDNLSTNATPETEETETTTSAFDEYEPIDDELPGLFSRHTINKYSSLFGHGTDNGELLEDLKLDPNGTYNELVDDLSVQQSQNPLATSPQIRELAQVFTHALSAYLQDPVQFRKVLSDIRPTHPSFTDTASTDEYFNTEPTTTVNEEDEEILGFSDDIKSRPSLASLRDSKTLNIGTEYSSVAEQTTTTPSPRTTESIPASYSSVTPRSPFRCCGRISASYTSPSTPIVITTPLPYTNTVSAKVNTLSNTISNKIVATTENSYALSNYGGFQNNTLSVNDSPYGNDINQPKSQPLNEYIEATNLPTAWGVDASESTVTSTIATPVNIFESKKIRTTTVIPETTAIYFTDTDSVELENEEELQRAHSQSFIGPQGNSLRQGKQLQFESSNETVRKPSEDLEAPTLPDSESTTAQTTAQPTITLKIEESHPTTTVSPISSSVFTSPDNDKTTNQFQWPSTFESWHSTIIDPITLNDGLSPSGPEEIAKQTNSWAASTTAVPTTEYTATSEQSVSSTAINIDISSPGNNFNDERFARFLKERTSTEPSQDFNAITDTVVEKAKEIMGGMNATTTEKLMNVMKKTKSKTVRRLILLLVQTCDDDHNTTAEASKKALLEALMAVSQKDMEEIAKEEEQQTEIPTTTTTDYEYAKSTEYRQTETSRYEERQEERARHSERRGKSLNFEASAVNSLSNPTSTVESVRPTTDSVRSTTEAIIETTTLPSRTTQHNRRGAKKFFVRTTVEPQATTTQYIDSPRAEARKASSELDLKGTSDTRALELLRSLYTIAARWG
ncbi:unnamed protein product [Diatraea saccharalis]|uniref:Mucin-5AC n=1 Tax=Diatraea saccharalis TaxID=40085 RepID=A0A9N9RAB0_9NEOP|nr:unnamed protein product [Diatraea saccharalis]